MVKGTGIALPQAGLTSKQNFRLMVALCLLLVALGVVLIKDREFWFGSEQALESETTSQSVANAKTNSVAAPARTVTPPVQKAAASKNHTASKPPTHPVAAAKAADPASPVVATDRVVLPPLGVEVVAGDTHRTVQAGNSATKVEILRDSNRASELSASANLPADAAQRERLATVSAPELRATVAADYPLLGQNMKVQGSVVLQAVIGADGIIENLRVVSGPAILATAAQQAVRQWHFKPYLQNGQPVETKTRITVNFSIRVADNPATTS
jgi:TonB family protein